ncbi:hypothetical protein BJV78DRAFT_1153299 [Lactifluus subvellereus]|nr:hypothetical protein BJV78DRAFT_1153299 [Lactifluus subvellereus]
MPSLRKDKSYRSGRLEAAGCWWWLASHGPRDGYPSALSQRNSTGARDLGPGHGIAEPPKFRQVVVAALTYLPRKSAGVKYPGMMCRSLCSKATTISPLHPFHQKKKNARRRLRRPALVPHRSSGDASQPWDKVRAWISRERGRAGKILQVALGAARAASASTNAVTPTPRRTAIENIVWDSRPQMEARLRDTQLTMFDWVNIRRIEEYHQKLDGPLPPIPPQTETGGRTHVVKRKPVPSLDNFHDESVHQSHLVKSDSPRDFRDSVSDQEDSDQDSYDQDMEYMLGDSDSEDDAQDRGLLVAEMCNKWGWTLEDVLETLEQPGLEGRRKCLREKGVLPWVTRPWKEGQLRYPEQEKRLVQGLGHSPQSQGRRTPTTIIPTALSSRSSPHRTIFLELVKETVPEGQHAWR